jgi:hypothetical protein
MPKLSEKKIVDHSGWSQHPIFIKNLVTAFLSGEKVPVRWIRQSREVPTYVWNAYSFVREVGGAQPLMLNNHYWKREARRFAIEILEGDNGTNTH